MVITDGADNASRVDQSTLEGMLRSAHDQMKSIDLNITLCFVGDAGGASRDLRGMVRAAPDVCKFVNVNRVSELESFFNRIARCSLLFCRAML